MASTCTPLSLRSAGCSLSQFGKVCKVSQLSARFSVKRNLSVKFHGRFTARSAVEVEGVSVSEPEVDAPAAPAVAENNALDSTVTPSSRVETKSKVIRNPRRQFKLDPKTIVTGQSYDGVVKSILTYGAFVDIGTFTDGLVHISELSNEFVEKVEDVVKIGDKLKVFVREVDVEKRRISLSLFDPSVERPDKKAEAAAAAAAAAESGESLAEPRGRAPGEGRKIAGRGNNAPREQSNTRENQRPKHNFKKGQVVNGVVKTYAGYGAFVELEEGVDGLLHSSEISVGTEEMPIESQVQIGQKVEVRITDVKGNRISLSMKPVLDMKKVNSLAGSQLIAVNPFAVAFRQYNLIPEEAVKEKVEEVAVAETIVEEVAVAETVVEEVVVAETVVEEVAVAETVVEEVAVAETVVEDASVSVPDIQADSASVVEEVKQVAEEDAVEVSVATAELASVEEAAVVEEEVTVAEPVAATVEEEVIVAEAAAATVEDVAAGIVVEEPSVEPTVSEDAVIEEAPTVLESAAAEVAVEVPPAVEEAVAAVVEEMAAKVEEVAAVEETATVTDSKVEVPVEGVAVPAEVPLSESTVAEVKEAPAPPKDIISATAVKALREETGAGMMACKTALKDANGDVDKAREILRKKGLASAEKKASRIATEGLIHSYIHDGRIGVLLEVNCETDFVSRGAEFKQLVDDLALQVAACPDVTVVSIEEVPAELVAKEREIELQREDLLSKPEAIRAKIVDGRIGKVLNKFALLEQPFIKDDKLLVKDLIKQAVAKIGENIQIRRFKRFNLGEGIEKKSSDFAAEVAAAAVVKEAPKKEEPKVEESAPAEAVPAVKVVVSASLVKELREITGAGMMDCKKALTSTNNDIEKASEFLRKKGLASADKKAGRTASEGLIGTYIHDGRIGVLVEVNCETDFVARGERFQQLVKDLAMQVAACPRVSFVAVEDIDEQFVAQERAFALGQDDLKTKPEAVRGKIVDGRVAKRLNELALLEQAYIKNDKQLVKDLVKETVAALGENIKVRRFERFNLGEGLEKKSTDFAAEVAAAAKVN